VNTERNIGLDLLRPILMLFGPIYHASLMMGTGWVYQADYQDSEWIKNIFSITHPFRMELFFLISGYLSALVLDRKGINYYKESRKRYIFIPTISSMVIILTIALLINYYILGYFNFNFQHIWFMISLSMISIFYLQWGTQTINLIKNTNKISISLILLVILFYVAGDYVFRRAAEMLPSLPEKIIVAFIVNPLYYILPSILGSVLYYKRFNVPTLLKWASALLFVAFYITETKINIKEVYLPAKIAFKAVYIIATSIFIYSIFELACNIKIKSNNVLRFLMASALTIYLIHHPLIILNGYLFNGLISDSLLYFTTVLIFTYAESFLFYLAIRNIKLFRFLFGLK